MDAAPQQVDYSRAGMTGMGSVAKHTILANPKATAILIGVLVVTLVVVAFLLYRSKHKEGFTSNFQTGGNQGQAIAMGGAVLDHTGAADSRSPVGRADMVTMGLMGDDSGSVTSFTDLIPASGSSAAGIAQADAKLGSLCGSASLKALAEHKAQQALNGGLSSGAATPSA